MTVFVPSTPNDPNEAIVTNGQTITIGEETFEFTVEDGVITAITVTSEE